MEDKYKLSILTSKKKEQQQSHPQPKISEEKSLSGTSLTHTLMNSRKKSMMIRKKTKRKKRKVKADIPVHSKDAPKSWRE